MARSTQLPDSSHWKRPAPQTSLPAHSPASSSSPSKQSDSLSQTQAAQIHSPFLET